MRSLCRRRDGYDMGAYESGAFADLQSNGEDFLAAADNNGGLPYGAITYGSTPTVLTGTLLIDGQAPTGAVLITNFNAVSAGVVPVD